MNEPNPNGRVTYDYECPSCGTQEERWVIRRLADEQRCGRCDAKMTRLLTGCQFQRFTPYWDDVIDDPPVFISSSKERKRAMKERNLVEGDTGNGWTAGSVKPKSRKKPGVAQKKRAKKQRLQRAHEIALEKTHGQG